MSQVEGSDAKVTKKRKTTQTSMENIASLFPSSLIDSDTFESTLWNFTNPEVEFVMRYRCGQVDILQELVDELNDLVLQHTIPDTSDVDKT
jgi:hypothetical protein